MSDYLGPNLAALAERNRRLADALPSISSEKRIHVTQSKSGFPVPMVAGLSIHSGYHPEKEGERVAASIEPEAQVVMFGFGFGYHIEQLAAVAGALTVIEPDEAMLAAAFAHRDLRSLLARLTLVTPDDFRAIANCFDYRAALWLEHEPTVRLHRKERNLLAEPFLVRSAATRNSYSVMVVGPVTGGSVPTTRSCAAALGALGFAVDCVDNTAYQPDYRRIDEATENHHHREQLRAQLTNYLGELVLARADHTRPDFIVALAQAPLSPEILQRLKRLDVPLIFWFVENHRVLPYWKNVAPHYDFFFGMQKDFPPLLIEAGAPFAGYLPQGADPDLHKPAKLSITDQKKYGAPLSFMGAGYPNRQKFFARLLDLPLKIWGTEWDLTTPLGKRVQNQNRRLEPPEYVKIFQAGEIHLNLHSSLTAEGVDPMADFTNPRTFELAACEAFQLVDNRDEIPDFFDVGVEIETFGEIEELREKIDYYQNNRKQREKIAAAGRRRVIREHSFVQRMATMMSQVLPVAEESRRKKEAARPKKTPGVNDVDRICAETRHPELKQFLSSFSGSGDLSLRAVMETIEKGEGPLSRAEALLLVINEMVTQGGERGDG